MGKLRHRQAKSPRQRRKAADWNSALGSLAESTRVFKSADCAQAGPSVWHPARASPRPLGSGRWAAPDLEPRLRGLLAEVQGLEAELRRRGGACASWPNGEALGRGLPSVCVPHASLPRSSIYRAGASGVPRGLRPPAHLPSPLPLPVIPPTSARLPRASSSWVTEERARTKSSSCGRCVSVGRVAGVGGCLYLPVVSEGRDLFLWVTSNPLSPHRVIRIWGSGLGRGVLGCPFSLYYGFVPGKGEGH